MCEKKENDNLEITAGAMCLGPSFNLQGRCDFMRLSSGELSCRNYFYPCIIAQDVANRSLENGVSFLTDMELFHI